MPRQRDDDNDDNEDGGGFDPEDYGWSPDEWAELLDIYGFDSDDEMLDAFPELADFSDWMDELDYLDELDHLDDDDDFYSSIS